jgi:DNA repair protein RecO (recombination protein O)
MEFIEAIVLKSLDYKDSSKILYLYTNNGLQSIIAHGVKKMNSINRFLSQNGNLINVTFSKGNFPSLKEGELLNDFPKIKSDVLAYTYLNHIMELVNNTISEDSDHPKMFRFLKRLFGLFNEQYDSEILSFIFELKLLYFIGYGLNFKHCNICSNNDNLVFSIDNGGLVCAEHLTVNQQSYDSKIFLLLSKMYYIDIDDFNSFELSKNERVIIRNIIDQLYDQYVSFKTKSRNILLQLQKY